MPTVLRLPNGRLHFHSDERQEPPDSRASTPDGELVWALTRAPSPRG
jgi:hypothetical protein